MPLLMMLVIFVPFFLLMSRARRTKRKPASSLKKGDRVMTNSGLVGELVEMDDRLAKVKIAPGVTRADPDEYRLALRGAGESQSKRIRRKRRRLSDKK